MKAAAALTLAFIVAAGWAGAEPFAYDVIDAAAVPVALGNLQGNASRGAALTASTCASCHGGEADLRGVDAGRLRLAIIDLSILAPDAATHAFYAPDAEGATPLSAQMIEDIIAHLTALPAEAAP